MARKQVAFKQLQRWRKPKEVINQSPLKNNLSHPFIKCITINSHIASSKNYALLIRTT